MVAVASSLPYPVVIAAGALEGLRDVVRAVAPAHRVVVITDERVGALHGSRILAALPAGDTALIRAPLSERTKTRESWAALSDELFARGCGRDTTVVAFGGGVVGDVAGFVAATYMRGVPVVQVPTTLLAMVDASIGGKTGVDTPAGKNLVGAFHQPSAVVIDPGLLETLPAEHLRAGFAEIIKHGVVADAEHFRDAGDFLRAGMLERRDWTRWGGLISRSVDIKSDIVARDERESGLRKVLNFGHTIAHALETASGYEMIHGHAVAAGMVIESRIGHLLGVTDAAVVTALETLCGAAGLPVRVPGMDPDRVIGLTRADKKARGGKVEYALPSRVGEMAAADRGYGIPVDDATVREALRS